MFDCISIFIFLSFTRISASIKGQLTEELFRTKAIPPNPVSMYHYAKTVSDAMFSLEKLNNHTSDNSRIKGKIACNMINVRLIFS